MTEIALPPYGYMPEGWEKGATDGPYPQNFDEKTWSEFSSNLGDSFAEVLWPKFCNGTWTGKATKTSLALTHADLELMKNELQGLHEKAVGGIGALASVTHKSLFLIEDDVPISGTLFETARRYMEGLPPALIGKFIADASRGHAALGPRPLMFKKILQRPRPHQAALILGQEFKREHAKSSVSPSMISGHSLQGLFLTTFAYCYHHVQIDSTANARENILKYSTDFGDRRVFAGVHYPSDNLASWYLTLELANVVFGPQANRARRFIADAIKQSIVFKAITKKASEENSAYKQPLEWLEKSIKTVC